MPLLKSIDCIGLIEAVFLDGGSTTIEVRPFYEAEDFGAEFTQELREQEDRLRAEIDRHEIDGQQSKH